MTVWDSDTKKKKKTGIRLILAMNDDWLKSVKLSDQMNRVFVCVSLSVLIRWALSIYLALIPIDLQRLEMEKPHDHFDSG